MLLLYNVSMSKSTEEKIEKIKSNKYISILNDVKNIFFNHNMNVYSGYATLYILMAMVPLLMLAISISNLFSSFTPNDVANMIVEFFPDIPWLQDILTDIFGNITSSKSGVVISLSLITTLWSASNGVSAIQRGLQEIHGEKYTLLGKPKALLFTIGFILLIPSLLFFQLLRVPITNFVTSFLSRFNLQDTVLYFRRFMQYSGILSISASILFILLAYVYLPNKKITFKSQLPGAIFTIVIAGIFTFAFSFFMGTFWKASSFYGSLVSVFLSALWVNYIVMIFFAGAALNKALED